MILWITMMDVDKIPSEKLLTDYQTWSNIGTECVWFILVTFLSCNSKNRKIVTIVCDTSLHSFMICRKRVS